MIKKLKILKPASINPYLVAKVAQFHAEFGSDEKHVWSKSSVVLIILTECSDIYQDLEIDY